MTLVAIVYHSAFGHTKRQAEAVAQGAASVQGVEVALFSVDEFEPAVDGAYGPPWDVLERADAIVLGCPTYMGSVSSAMKLFMERSSGLWFQQLWKDKLAGGFTNGGALAGDKLNTLVDMVLFAAQQGMIWVNLGIPISESTMDGDPNGLNRMGAWLGAFAKSDDAPPDKTPPPGDLATARAYGERIARLSVRMAST